MFSFWKKKTQDAAGKPEAKPGEAAAPVATPAPATASPISPPPAPAAPSVPPAPPAAAKPLADDALAELGASSQAAPAAPGKLGWRERLRQSILFKDVRELMGANPILDDAFIDEIETALITCDVGVTASGEIAEKLRRRTNKREFANAKALLAALRVELISLLQPVAVPLRIDRSAKPFVILTVGVNGVGKTTTIGKLTRRFQHDGYSLMLAAGDTFRAAAVEQLKVWGERNNVAVVAQASGSDAASVTFDAMQAAKSRGIDVLIADTAGRLHTQSGLMNELGKIGRVLARLDANAPHEVLMVIDGTTGQNAISQLRQFHAIANVTGLVVTKLDGTARGGVIFALAREFGIPIRYVGLGERLEDLRTFDPEAFVDALMPETLGA